MAADSDDDISDTWYQFTQESSLHGIGHICDKASHIIRRILWLIMFLGALTFFSYSAYKFLDGYTKKLLATRIKVEKANQLTFPTVTICNNNLWRKSELNTTASSLNSDVLLEAMKDLYDITREVPPPASKYNWSDPDLETIYLLEPFEIEDFLERSAHQMNETFIHCRIFGKDTACTQVFTVQPTDGEYCFQFNSDGSKTATTPGKTGGITLLLNTNVEEYTTGPNSQSEGMSTIRYPPPADDKKSDCFDTDTLENPLHYYKNYSYSACQVECQTSYVINKCGCSDPFQPALNNTEMCTLPKMLYCSNPALDRFPGDATEGLKVCKCPDPCKESEYTSKISTFRFPSRNYILEQGDQSETVDEMRRNYIMVDIFYAKMSYHKVEEYLPYNIYDVIGNLGGTLGLCVGASTLSLYETLEFGVISLVRFLMRRSAKKKPNVITPHKVIPVLNYTTG